jgi:hypothetical protein
MRRTILLWAIVAVSAAASSAAAASPGTVLYLHVFNGQDMPINPQAPGADYAIDDDFGAATSSLGCFPTLPGVGFIEDFHTVYGYATPSPLHYERGGEPEVHPSRGLLGSVPLEGAAPMMHWYWSTQVAAGEGPAPTPVPNVVVQATMRAGAAISVNDVAYNEGELLAEGRSQPATLAGDASTGVEHSIVGDRHVYHFAFPLEVQAAAIPKEGYNLRIDTYVLRDGCPADGYLMPNVINVHSSPGHRPRLELATVQAPAIVGLDARLENGSWLFDVRANSPWGGVDVGNITVEVEGPTTPSSVDAVEYEAVHCHCDTFGGYNEVYTDARFAWDAAADAALDGDYVVRVHLTNLQGSSEAFSEERFAISTPKESPGVAPGFAVIGLAGLALLLRRGALT